MVLILYNLHLAVAFNATQEPTYGTPESHIWRGISSASNDVFIYNTLTGEVRGLGNGLTKTGVYTIMTNDNK